MIARSMQNLLNFFNIHSKQQWTRLSTALAVATLFVAPLLASPAAHAIGESCQLLWTSGKVSPTAIPLLLKRKVAIDKMLHFIMGTGVSQDSLRMGAVTLHLGISKIEEATRTFSSNSEKPISTEVRSTNAQTDLEIQVSIMAGSKNPESGFLFDFSHSLNISELDSPYEQNSASELLGDYKILSFNARNRINGKFLESPLNKPGTSAIGTAESSAAERWQVLQKLMTREDPIDEIYLQLFGEFNDLIEIYQPTPRELVIKIRTAVVPVPVPLINPNGAPNSQFNKFELVSPDEPEIAKYTFLKNASGKLERIVITNKGTKNDLDEYIVTRRVIDVSSSRREGPPPLPEKFGSRP